MTLFVDLTPGDPAPHRFGEIHHGDKVQVRRPELTWSDPYRLLTDPTPCGDPSCPYLHCNAVDGMGHVEPLAEPEAGEIYLLEYGPTSRSSECAGVRAEVAAEHDQTGGAR